MMKFNKKQAVFKRPKNFLFAVISCFLLVLAFSTQSVFAAGSSPTPPVAATDLSYKDGTDMPLVNDSAATQEVVWEYAVTSTNAKEAPEYGWSTEKPKRNIGAWRVWYRTEGNNTYDALSGYFDVQIKSGNMDICPMIADNLTYTGELMSLLSEPGNVIPEGATYFCVTGTNATLTSENWKEHAWFRDAEATDAGHYRIWVSTSGDGAIFDESGKWVSGTPISLKGYMPVTIYSENGEVPETPSEPKLYIYIRAVNAD